MPLNQQGEGSPEQSAGEANYLTGCRAAQLLVALFLVSIVAQVDRILPFILAESIKTEFSLSDTQIGLMTGAAFALCYTLLSLPLASLADRGSPRLVLVGCALMWSAMTALGGLATSFVFLALTRLGVAVGEAGAIPSAHTLIARRIRPDRRGTAIGIFTMGIPVGGMTGFAVGGAVNDAYGWQAALIGAGALSGVIALIAYFAAGPTPPLRRPQTSDATPYLRQSLALLASPAFRWLFIAAVTFGFAAAPLFAFAGMFLIRVHGFSATDAGLAFGALQGLLGIAGTLTGGRAFDRAVRIGRPALRLPAALLLLASASLVAALLVKVSWLAILFCTPAMFAFTFLLPHAFGSAHRVAGEGREAMGSSLALIGTGLIGPAIGPLLVGAISDWATAADMPNGLSLAMMIAPLAALLTAIACHVADEHIGRLVVSCPTERQI
ncbi:MFS transporter [Sphingomonas spermidinifaciens]|uniref:MFS transporter n=1 Tax=Sphingomonas spermidinifaciens TaxID=1141889 RepID=A0A2A4B289_9SPHN|nr:MFS transporter [Sphingomonas spermidinifaciens]PCD02177.1 MFS transporter [Sphingomonas spermidinifaciens]